MAEEDRLRLVLEDAASTGVRVAGLRLANHAIGFIASVVIARELGPEGRGLYALPVALLGIVMALAHVGIEHASVYLAARGVALRRLWASSAVVAMAMSGVAIALVLGARSLEGPSFLGGLPLEWIAVAVGQVPILLMNLYWSVLLQLDGRLRSAALAGTLATTVHAMVVLVLAALGTLTPFRILGLAWVVNGLTWILLLRLGARAGLVGARPEVTVLRRALAFGLRAHVATVFVFLLLRVDQVLVERKLGFEALGLYSLAVVLAEILWLATDAFAASLLPHQVRAEAGDERRLGFATARLSLLVVASGGAIAWVVAPWAIRLTYGDAFEGAASAFRFLLPGVAALALLRPLQAILLKEGRVGVAASLSAAALVLNVGFNLLLLEPLGVRGAAIASSVTYLLLAAGYVAAVHQAGVVGVRDLLPRRADASTLRRAASRGSRRARRPGPPRAVLVIGTLERGGSERQLAYLASGLVARGWEVRIVCLSAGGPLERSLRSAGVDVVIHRFAGRPPLRRIASLFRELRAIRSSIAAVDPDVVHAFLYWGCLIGLRAGRAAGARALVGTQRSLRSALGAVSFLRWWERSVQRHADAWICNSEAVRADAVRHGVPMAKAVVVRNGVPAGPLHPPVILDRPRVLCVANLIGYKGHDLLLEAFARVNAPAELRLAGAGPEEEALRRRAAGLGLGDRVRFLGSVPDISVELERCAFSVLASRSEGMPNAVLESLAVGRAVVATDVGGVREVLAEGGGLLVPAGDVDELARAIARLLTDPALAARMGAEGYRAVRARYGVDDMIEATLAVYRATPAFSVAP